MAELNNKIIEIITNSKEPLTTQEIAKKLNKNRNFVLNRLLGLVQFSEFRCKQSKSYGTWVWWLPITSPKPKKELEDKKEKLEKEIQKLRNKLKEKEKILDDKMVSEKSKIDKNLLKEIKNLEDEVGELEFRHPQIPQQKRRIASLVGIIEQLVEDYFSEDMGEGKDLKEYLWRQGYFEWGILDKYF